MRDNMIRVHLDVFTTLDGLTKQQRTDPDAVLAALGNVKRLSVWDMDDDNLRRVIDRLERDGKIETDSTVPYPWIGIRVLPPTMMCEGEQNENGGACCDGPNVKVYRALAPHSTQWFTARWCDECVAIARADGYAIGNILNHD